MCTILRLIILNSVSLFLLGLAFTPSISQLSITMTIVLISFFTLIIQISRISWTLFLGMTILILAIQVFTQATLGISQAVVLMSSVFATILFLNAGVTLFVSYLCTTLFFNITLLLSSSIIINSKIILLLHILNFMFAYAISITSRLGVVLLILIAVIAKTLFQLGCILPSVDTQVSGSELTVFAILACSLIKAAYFGYLPIVAAGNLILVQILAASLNLHQEIVFIIMILYAILFAVLLLSNGEQGSIQLILVTTIYAGFPLTSWSTIKFMALSTTQTFSGLGIILYLLTVLALLLSTLHTVKGIGSCDSRNFFPILIFI